MINADLSVAANRSAIILNGATVPVRPTQSKHQQIFAAPKREHAPRQIGSNEFRRIGRGRQQIGVTITQDKIGAPTTEICAPQPFQNYAGWANHSDHWNWRIETP